MKRSFFLPVLIVGLLFAAIVVTPSGAAVPSNDNFANATAVTTLPFSDPNVAITEATNEVGEPSYWAMGPSVWYVLTPSTDAVLTANVSGASYYSINAYRQDGSDMNGLSYITGYLFSGIVFSVQAGSTYYVQAGMFDSEPLPYGDTFTVNIDRVPPPSNDNFADAIPVTSLPFADSQDLTGATLEPGEPTLGGLIKSVWYSFTPASSGSYTTSWFGGWSGVQNVYTGTSLDDLTQINSGGYFHGDAGTTYYIQTGDYYNTGPIETRVNLLPPPSVGFQFGPGYPSTFDTLSFQGICYDPVGISSWSWTFGDGATATVSNPVHQYKKDGDYSITVAVTTPDGRANSYTQVVPIRTHDVSIQYFSTTTKGRVGWADPLQVGIGNTRYPESVQVVFYKSTQGWGFQPIGSVTKTIPVMKAKQTTMVAFNYIFTTDDLAIGKLNFQAVVTILGDRPAIDAFPSDNTAISQTVTVTR